MNKVNRDKIITLVAFSIFGYYISISMLRGILYDFLIKFLPPINDRHLPQVYTGILGAVLFLIIAYLVFIFFVEKKKIVTYKKTYVISIILLILSPFIIGGIFRLHSAGIVKSAENTTPTRFEITLKDEKMMFETGKGSATGWQKRISVAENDLEKMGQFVKNLKIKNIQEERIDNTKGTIWINYENHGKWYSKIMNFNQDVFEENVSKGNIAVYENNEFLQEIQRLIKELENLNIYEKASIVNSETIENKEYQVQLKGETLEELFGYIKNENKIEPDKEIVEKLTWKGRNQFIPKDNKDIYGIFLTDSNEQTKNFMVYDKSLGIIKFENNYYKADLDPKFLISR